MRKTSAALALATLIVLAGPVAAQADDQYPPAPPSPAPVSTVVKTTGPTVVNTSTGSTGALPSTGLSDAVVPIGIAGGVLALGGVALLASRRAARR